MKRICSRCQNERMGEMADFCDQCGTKLPPLELDQDELRDKARFQAKSHNTEEFLANGFPICGPFGHLVRLTIIGEKSGFCPACGEKVILPEQIT